MPVTECPDVATTAITAPTPMSNVTASAPMMMAVFRRVLSGTHSDQPGGGGGQEGSGAQPGAGVQPGGAGGQFGGGLKRIVAVWGTGVPPDGRIGENSSELSGTDSTLTTLEKATSIFPGHSCWPPFDEWRSSWTRSTRPRRPRRR